MLVGLVSYTDDGKVFRKVCLQKGESPSVLDDRKWVTLGCNPARHAVMRKVLEGSPEAMAAMTGVI